MPGYQNFVLTSCPSSQCCTLGNAGCQGKQRSFESHWLFLYERKSILGNPLALTCVRQTAHNMIGNLLVGATSLHWSCGLPGEVSSFFLIIFLKSLFPGNSFLHDDYFHSI